VYWGGLLAGFFEELGWTGFAIPRLRLRFATGLLWGAWHFPLFREGDGFSGMPPLALLVVQLFAWLPAYRVLMVWVYERTGSLLVAMLMQANLSASKLMLQPGASPKRNPWSAVSSGPGPCRWSEQWSAWPRARSSRANGSGRGWRKKAHARGREQVDHEPAPTTSADLVLT
jgi:hypothetical protein